MFPGKRCFIPGNEVFTVNFGLNQDEKANIVNVHIQAKFRDFSKFEFLA